MICTGTHFPAFQNLHTHSRLAVNFARFPILAISPEGTTKSSDCLLTFSTGAFVGGRPVLPVLLHYRSRQGAPFPHGLASVLVTAVFTPDRSFKKKFARHSQVIKHEAGLDPSVTEPSRKRHGFCCGNRARDSSLSSHSRFPHITNTGAGTSTMGGGECRARCGTSCGYRASSSTW